MVVTTISHYKILEKIGIANLTYRSKGKGFKGAISMRIPSRAKIVLLLTFFPAIAVISVRGQDGNQWTPDDLLLAESAGDYEISPDGTSALWVKTQMNKEKGERISNIYLSSLTSEVEIQLTRGKHSHSDPKWSTDGKLIAFLSNRPVPDKNEDKPKNRIWLLNPAGGEPWPAADLERAVRSFGWQDSDHIIFIAQEPPGLYEQEIEDKEDTSKVVEDEVYEPPVRVFQLDVKEKEVLRITDNTDWIRDIAVSPDGKWAVTRHDRSLSWVFDHKVLPALFLTNLETGETRQIEPDRRMVVRGVEWSKDSSGFYYATEYSSDPVYFTATITLLYYFDLNDNRSVQVDLERANGLGGDLEAVEGGFMALLADGVRFRPARYRKEGLKWTISEIEGEHATNIFGWVTSLDGDKILYKYSTASTPEQWYQATLEGTQIVDAKRLTKLNPTFEKKPTHRSKVISWIGANGNTVEGILYYPTHYQEGKRYPLMLSIHGGPSGTDMDKWSEHHNSPKVLLTQKGAFVLKVNYHGSGNYGLEWVESICCGKYYDLERVDIENGVDYLIEEGLVDPERLGTMGWSNGAILTTELITRSDRFKVASVGAGDVEWISDWGNVKFGASFDNYYFGKPPYADPKLYIEKSPYFRLKNVTTPTIIYTGTEDVNVPPSQSWSHYRVIQQTTDTPVRFILFPGEPHGLRKYQHQKRKLEEDLAWFDKYLFELTETEAKAIKEGSPLDMILKLSGVAKVGQQYGVEVNGILTPEVVEYSGLQIGRFEVTRAQFAVFDSSDEYESGTDNWPASGISFDGAREYADWLSQQTGETFRIPTADEVENLYEKARGKGNNLDHWAGYAPNLADTIKLRQQIEQLDSSLLLKEVGSSEPLGKEPFLSDLGGNVAEWAVDEDGQGKLVGGSVDLPAKSLSDEFEAMEAFRGLRVVKGPAQAKKE